MTAKKSTKTGKNLRGGGEEIFFWLARIYTPAVTPAGLPASEGVRFLSRFLGIHILGRIFEYISESKII